MSHKLFAFFIVLAPLAAHVACSATNGEAIRPELREAGAAPDNRGSGREEEDKVPSRDGGAIDTAQGDATAPADDAGADVDAGEPAPVQISEIYVDIDGVGDAAEFVELRAEPGTALDDLKLRIIDRVGTVKYTVTVAGPGEVAGASGFWVVGGNQTFKLGVLDRVDRMVSVANWGLDARRGAVQLLRGPTVLDVVGWSEDGDAGAPPPTTPPSATVEGQPVMVPTIKKTPGQPAHSFGRRAGAPDTNDNRADFCSMAASPGYEQKPCD